LAFVSVLTGLFLVGLFGAFLLHQGMEQVSGISQTSPTPEVSLGSPMATIVQSTQPESNTTSVVPEPPVENAENFPGTQTRELANYIRGSRPAERKATSETRIPNGGLLAPHSAANHARAAGRDVPPDLIGADSNTGAELRGFLATLMPSGGRVKEPVLLLSSAPSYPALARQAHVEGQVTIEAVIDTTGKLTNMTVVSGEALLQRAALDSLRTWKYRPAYLNENPVPSKTSITVNFHLER
jgi:TonB family protein